MSGPQSASPQDPRFVVLVRAAMEFVVLALVVLAPWAFGGFSPTAELGLAVGVAVLLGLWAVVAVATGRVTVGGPVAGCLAGIAVLGFLQIVPVPAAVQRALSPGGVDLRNDLLPDQPELLTADDSVPPAPAAWPLSLYPYVTRVEAVRWLAVFAVFVAVRGQIANPASFRRLCVAATVNGTLLALFGIAHRLSARPGRVYWVLETAGEVFGPFVYRNHYAAYANLCLALAVGLLLATRPAGDPRYRRAADRGGSVSPADLLQSPGRVWACLALAVMLGGLVVSLSRGGVVALAIGSAALLLVQARRPGGPGRLHAAAAPVVLFVTLAVGLLAVLGVNPLETRLATLWTGGASADERWQIWRNTLAVVPHFLLAGSGYATLPYVEPVYRVRPYMAGEGDWGAVSHAHCDYLQALAEGGILRLALTAVLVVAAVRLGVRAVRRQAGRSAGPLAVGGLLAVLTLAAHALFDFVIPVPAVGLLAAVVTAHLAALAAGTTVHRDATPPRPGVAGRACAAAAAGTVAVVVVLQAWQAATVHRLRVEAAAALRPGPADFDRAARLLGAAVAAAPDHAEARSDLGLLLLDARETIVAGRRAAVRAAAAGGAAAAATAGPAAGVVAVLAWPDAREPAATRTETFERLVVPGLRQLGQARTHCPLLPMPHLRFAGHAADLARHDPPAAYLARARRLVPLDPDLWYVTGVQHLRDGQPAQAAASWRRSLALSDRHFDAVLTAVLAGGAGPAGEAVDAAMPDDPGLLLAAAGRVGPGGPRRGLLDRALGVLAARPDPRPAAEYRLRGQILNELGRPDAVAAYEQAVLAAPERWDWRSEYARVLVEWEHWDRAAAELRLVLGRSADREADRLLARVERERAIDRGRPTGGVGRGPAPAGFADALAAAPGGPVTDGSALPGPVWSAALEATGRLTHPRTGETGSAVAVARDRSAVYLLTAAHLVLEPLGDDVEVQFYSAGGRPEPRGPARTATVKARAREADLAVLAVLGPDGAGVLPVCPPGGTAGRQPPFPVLAVGCDRGGPTAMVDRAAAVRFVTDPYRANFYETDIAQAPGRSGGPLVDGRGYVIGVCSGTRGGKGYYASTSEIHHALRAAGFDWFAAAPK